MSPDQIDRLERMITTANRIKKACEDPAKLSEFTFSERETMSEMTVTVNLNWANDLNLPASPEDKAAAFYKALNTLGSSILHEMAYELQVAARRQAQEAYDEMEATRQKLNDIRFG